jgi:glycosyltransferase involved in cell wall biosynthesis
MLGPDGVSCVQISRSGWPVLKPTFVVLSFEGFDPYAQAGGLGTRVTELATALAEHGYPVHVVFVGDPHRPGEESHLEGCLTLHRWCQWISAYYPDGVYQGEEDKLRDFTASAPQFIVDQIAKPAIAAGRTLVVLAEEWHTAQAICETSDLLWASGLRDKSVLLWNANNTLGFERINWERLAFTSTITTVSRYMKHMMWSYGVNPLVIPNGIPRRLLDPVDSTCGRALRESMSGEPLLLKVARFDPDKRWAMALETTAQLKEAGAAPTLVARGGLEGHGSEVLAHARALDLTVRNVRISTQTAEAYSHAFSQAGQADILNVTSSMNQDMLRLLYHNCDAVLANSGREPFGLVGLEAMAAGGTVFTGATGEEYVSHLENAIVLETDDPREAAWYMEYLREHPTEDERMREAARETAERYVWDRVISNLLAKVDYLARGRPPALEPDDEETPPAGLAIRELARS